MEYYYVRIIIEKLMVGFMPKKLFKSYSIKQIMYKVGKKLLSEGTPKKVKKAVTGRC